MAIVDTGSFAGAARRLGIAQPSVSAHIAALERESGTRLFDRASGRQALLTEAGRHFLVHARELLDRTARLEDELEARRSAADTTIAFSCQRSLAHTVLRAPLARFARERREMRLSVRIAFQEEVHAAVRMGAADIGCILSSNQPADVPSILIGHQRLVVFAAPDHPLAGRRRIAPQELSGFDFIGPVANSLFGKAQRSLLAGIGIERMRVVAEGTEFSLVRDLVGAGLGLGCSLFASVAEDLASGRMVLVDLDAPHLFLDVQLLLNPQRRSVPVVRDFAEFLRQALRESERTDGG